MAVSAAAMQTENVVFDTRRSLGEFRGVLAEALKVDGKTFKVRKQRYGPELKNSAKKLTAYNFYPPCSVWLDLGTPLEADQYIVKLHVELDKKAKKGEDRYGYATDIQIGGSNDMKTVKDAIHKALPEAPPTTHMRIRELRGGFKLGSVFFDDKTFKKNLPGLKDFDSIVVQKTAIAEVLTSDTLLLNVYRWHTKEGKLEGPIEMAFSKHMKISELQTTLGMLSGIPAEEVKVDKPAQWRLKDISNMPLLPWGMRKLKLTGKIGNRPWRARAGDNIVYKDGRVKEEIETGTADKCTYQPAPERSIKILSPEEIEAREQRIKEAEEKYRADAKEAAVEAAAGEDGGVPPPPMDPPSSHM